MGEIDLLWGNASVITDLFAYWALQFLRCQNPSSSDMDGPMRSLGGHTVPYGTVGILPAVMMVVAGFRYVDFC